MNEFDVNRNEEKIEEERALYMPVSPSMQKIMGNNSRKMPNGMGGINVSARPTNSNGRSNNKSVNNAGNVNEVPPAPLWNENANVPIRASMTDVFGVDNDKISYKDGTVYLDGKEFIRAENNKNGTTYVSSEESFNKSFADYAQNNNVVAVRDYVTSSGTAANIGFNPENGTVSINGRNVKPLYILNGKAYMPKSELDAILAEERNTSGTSYKNINDEVSAEYDPGIKKAYSKYMNSEGFSYNPDDDPAYQAYRKAMEKAAQEEYDNNTAAARFRTGGVASSGAMQTAAAIREDAMDDVKAARAEFEQRAYQRYLDNLALERDKVALGESLKWDEYSALADVNQKDKSDTYYAESYDKDQQLQDIVLKYAEDDADIENKLSEVALADAELNYDLAEKYSPVLADIEVKTAQSDFAISEKYAQILAALDVDNAILQRASTITELKHVMREYGYSETQINDLISTANASYSSLTK